MRIANATNDALVLETSHAEWVQVWLVWLAGLVLCAIGYGMYQMYANYVPSDADTGLVLLVCFAPGVAACLLGICATGLRKRLVFSRGSAACECISYWSGALWRRLVLSPANIVCSEHHGKHGVYYDVIAYRRADAQSSGFRRLTSRLKGQAIFVGRFTDRASVQALLERISTLSERQVAVYRPWNDPRKRR